jgi:hypothetical protein
MSLRTQSMRRRKSSVTLQLWVSVDHVVQSPKLTVIRSTVAGFSGIGTGALSSFLSLCSSVVQVGGSACFCCRALLTTFSRSVSGYGTCTLFGLMEGAGSVFATQLTAWVRAFYSIAVIQNVMTTGLMAWRIYTTHKRTSGYKTSASMSAVGVLRILIESAALQLIAEVILLILYCVNDGAQFILLEAITPLVVSASVAHFDMS